MGNERISPISSASARISASAVDSARASLLLVESDPDKQWRMARTLTVHGYRVVGTVSGEGALALMGQWPVDLVLIARRIRDEDGLDVVARLSAAHPRAPIAVMADELTPGLREAARASGAVGVVRRPPAVDALQRLIVDSRTQAPLTIPAE